MSFRSRRLQAVPTNVFLTMDDAKARAQQAGHDVIDLSIGSSDLAPPPPAIEALAEAAGDPTTYGYPLYGRTEPLRAAAAAWMNHRFDLALTPADVLALIGAQEGLAHLLLALTDPGDLVLLTEPAYPSYFGACALAGVTPYALPLTPDRDFLPDLAAVPPDVAHRAKLLLLNYPNNPTAGVATPAFFAAAVAFCERHDLALVHDAPYTELTFGDYRAPSVLAAPGAMARAIELHSCSKTYHLAGLRIGWAAGCPDLITALAAAKGPVDFNQYLGVRRAAVAALASDPARVRADAAVYERRRDGLLTALAAIGWRVPAPRASMYLWAPLPAGHADSFAFCAALCAATGVALAPGRAFGASGEGWARFALVREPAALTEAARRIGRFLG